jgi:hypothetical protein
MINTEASIALAATAADLPAFRHLCILFFLPRPPRRAASPTGRPMSLADRFSHHHRQARG